MLPKIPKEVMEAITKLLPNKDFAVLYGWLMSTENELARRCATSYADDTFKRNQGGYKFLTELNGLLTGSKDYVEKLNEKADRRSERKGVIF